jgi:hypothetical protein
MGLSVGSRITCGKVGSALCLGSYRSPFCRATSRLSVGLAMYTPCQVIQELTSEALLEVLVHVPK